MALGIWADVWGPIWGPIWTASQQASYTPAGILWRGKRRRGGGGKYYTLATQDDWIRYLRDIGELPPEAPLEDAPPVPETVEDVEAWEDKIDRLYARTAARLATAQAGRAELERKAKAMREFDAYLDELARKAEADEDDDLEVLMLAV